MLLLTGATGTIGRPLLRRLTAAGTPVRCLVRDPRRLGPERVRVQIALGDLSDHLSFRHALRGIDTVIHLASVIRDQPVGSIEELAGVATWRLVRAAERAGVKRFVFFSALGASTRSGARLLRAKAIAERALVESSLTHTVFAPGWVYSPSDPFFTLVERMSLLPAVPIPGSGAGGVSAHVGRGRGRVRARGVAGGADGRPGRRRAVRAGRTGDAQLPGDRRDRAALDSPRAADRGPAAACSPAGLSLVELLMGPTAFATRDEVDLLQIPLTAQRGVGDAQRLGVEPKPMRAVLGVG